jgi:Zn-dependent M28 family amino/carboxypeptidase
MGHRQALRVGLMAAIALSVPALALPTMDSDTLAWWRTTSVLSADDMHGRDTGSLDHARAVAYVVERFRAAGLQAAGEHGGFTQSVALHEIKVEKAATKLAVVDANGALDELQFLHDITVTPTAGLPASLDAAMSFRGYCSATDMDPGLKGEIVVCVASRHPGRPSAAQRLAAAAGVGVAGLINVDDRGFEVEPPRWPEAYARAVTLRAAPPPVAPPVVVLRLNAAAFARLIAGSGRASEDILNEGAASRPLPHFDLAKRFKATFAQTQSEYTSDNVLALLPGTMPSLSQEIVVVSAHLDGYGIGEPVNGDSIYNATFDDAAYVSTLIQFAELRKGRGLRRPVLFAVFTGEEKGLLGSSWFVQHPSVPLASMAAEINLDVVRPLFPLKILTVLSMTESTLGDAARATGANMGIEIRADREPERNLRQRTDHWPFLNAGIPAICFVFGYDPGTESERIYRAWYRDRYHKPQDDLEQPFDGKAAKDFNDYLYRLVGMVADGAARPALITQ